MAAGLASPAAAAAAEPVQLDVGLEAGADAAAIVAALDKSVVVGSEPVRGLPAVTIDVVADQADAALSVLNGTAGVRYAERGAVVKADAADYFSTQFNNADVPAAWTWTTGDSAVTIAVVDTGVSATTHLAAERIVAGYDFVDGDADAADADGHGTLVAGAVAADNDNNLYSAGVCPACRVMPVRVLSDRGTAPAEGTTADVAAGIAWAADQGAPIINVSASTTAASRLLEDAVKHADGKGALVVASSGNDRSNVRHYPGAFEPALAVSAGYLGATNTAADPWVDLKTDTGGQWYGLDGKQTSLLGSSAGAAYVSGIAGLALALDGDASSAEVRDALKRTGERRTAGADFEPVWANAAKVAVAFGAKDETAPTADIGYVTEGARIGGAVEWFSGKGADDRGIERVEVYLAGQLLVTGYDASYSDTIYPPKGLNGPAQLTVKVYDFGGNSAEKTINVVVDTTAPVATIVSPAENAIVGPGGLEVVLDWPDSDAGTAIFGPARFYPGSLSRVPGTNKWKGTLGSQWYSSGVVDLYLRDETGNLTYLYRKIRYDGQPPAGGTITPSYGQRFRGNFTSTLSGVTDLGGVAKAELWANGRYMGADTTAPYALTVRPGTYSGNVMLTWRVTDRFGQWRNVPNRLVVADNKVPTVSITKAPRNKAKVKGTVKVYVKASDASGISRVELIVNGKVVSRDYKAGYVLSVNTKKQKKTMKVQIRAYDRVGNVKYTTTRTWRR
ncbi:S8 family serine peptidase [Actinoplanes sp. NPDC051861]|uniref:S8 family serine peptidase n=1 Tax=Actinoplanes sp. NPDC051861 TaxID=3155170 RepID=UPI00343828DF